jgi:alpha,alpha-trehalose phosphorylase
MAVYFAEKHASSKRLKELLDKLGVTTKELKEIKAAAEKMYFPYDEELGINPQDDSFLQKPVWDLKNTPKEEFPLLLHYHPLHLYRYQVCKQADTVLSYFLFEDRQPKEVMKKSFEYYEKITTHDSSLSTCVFSIVASRLGMHKKAVDYFGDSIKLDLMNTHNNSGDGVHTANMGGSYMAIVNGFAGLRINAEGISVDPFLPTGWKKYSFKIKYRKSLLKFTVTKSGAVCEVLRGEKIEVKGVKEMRYEK